MRQEPSNQVAARLAASLTPTVVRLDPPRGKQSSGLFDLDALYERASRAVEIVPVLRRAPPPLPARARRAPAAAAHLPSLSALAVPVHVPRVGGVGWFGVVVAWLATSTLATLAATQVTAHVGPARARVSAAAVVVAPVPSEPPAGPPALPVAPAAASAAATVSLPAAPKTVVAVAAAPRRVVTPLAPLAPRPSADASRVVRSAAPPAKPAPAPSNLSLEDLIRREVAAESKKR
jgi:hypothetical protein